MKVGLDSTDGAMSFSSSRSMVRNNVVDPQYVEITEPVLLDPRGPAVEFRGIPTTVVRLRYCALAEVMPPGSSRSGNMTWFFEYKRSEKDDWVPGYIFSTDNEWFLEDLPIMNVWLAKADNSYLVSQIMTKKLLLAEEDDPNRAEKGQLPRLASSGEGLLNVPVIMGTAELAGDNFRVLKYGKKAMEETIHTEEERLEILRTWFSIILTEEEVKAISEKPTKLK